MASLRPIDFGLPTDKSAMAVRLGIERGIFADEGIDLRIQVMFGGPLLAKAYDSGALSFGQMGTPPAINALERGGRFRIVGGGLRRKAHMYLSVRTDIADFDGLKSGRIGLLSMGSCDEWFCRVLFQRAGLDPDADITFVPLGTDYPRTVELIESGDLEAALAIEPNVSIGEARGVLKMWKAVHEEPGLPPFQWIVRIANQEMIEREPELVRAVLRGCRPSAHYAASHAEDWAEFMMERFGMAQPTAERVIARELPHMHLDGEVDMAGIKAVIAIQRELGAIDGPLAAADIVDLRFLEPDGTA